MAREWQRKFPRSPTLPVVKGVLQLDWEGRKGKLKASFLLWTNLMEIFSKLFARDEVGGFQTGWSIFL